MNVGLNARQLLFVEGMVAGKSAREAYIAAGFKAKTVEVADAASSRLLGSVKVQQILNQVQVKAMDAAGLTAEWIIEQIIDTVRVCRQAVPVLDADGKPIGEYRADNANALKGLELLGRSRAMFIERQERDTTIKILVDKPLNDEQWEEQWNIQRLPSPPLKVGNGHG